MMRTVSRPRKPASRLRFYLLDRHGTSRPAVDPLLPKAPQLLDSDRLRQTLDAPFRDCHENGVALRLIFATRNRCRDFGGKVIRQRNL